MNEYIEKAAILSKCEEMWNNADETTQTGVDTINAIDMITDFIEAMKAADVQPVKRGEWKYYKNTGIFDIHKCSVCATPFELPMDIVPSSVFCFCPHCGARMDGDTE